MNLITVVSYFHHRLFPFFSWTSRFIAHINYGSLLLLLYLLLTVQYTPIYFNLVIPRYEQLVTYERDSRFSFIVDCHPSGETPLEVWS